jgi:hypothetical protein
MMYSLSFLLFILGLLVGFPALRKIRHILVIRKRCEITMGNVVSTTSAMNTAGWLMGMVSASELVNQQRPLVSYHAPGGKELSIEVIPSNFLSGRKYRAGESIEVAYDRLEPWHAYAVQEWTAAWRELGIGAAISVLAILMWIMGRVYNLPF